MPPSSSTSASEASAPRPRHGILPYLAGALAGGIGALIVVSILSWVCLSNGIVGWHFAKLYRYQLAKLAAAPPERPSIALVGDSSLGNAVDAQAWSTALQRPVISLALTGDYGYRGTLNMMRRVLRSRPVALVVIFQTLDIATRAPAYDGQVYTAQRLGDLADVPPLHLFDSLASLDPLASALALLFSGSQDMSALEAVDYQPQAPVGRRRALAPVDAPALSSERIRAENLETVAKIAKECREHGIRCLYVNGPLIEPQCSRSADYVRTLDEAIRRAGLTVAPNTPICMPRGDAGDSEDHVAPERKARYSELYLDRVRAAIGPGAQMAASLPRQR